MELMENMGQKLSNISEKISDIQGKFFESNFGQIINSVLDVGIRVALPDFSENMMIDIKNALFENGLKDGVKQIWTNIKEYGKSFLGISTGKFNNIDEIQKATKTGGILDTISSAFDFALEKSVENGKITRKARQSIKKQKNSMIKDMKKEILDEVDNQSLYIEKINQYKEKWQECFDNKDLKGMKNANKNIKKYMEKVVPLEDLLSDSKKIDVIQSLVESTGSFEVTKEEQELAKVLT